MAEVPQSRQPNRTFKQPQGMTAPVPESLFPGMELPPLNAKSADSGHVQGLEADSDEALITISLVKGPERWHFRWSSGDEATLINRIAELARDSAVPFDWYDAAVVCKHIAQPFGTKSAE